MYNGPRVVTFSRLGNTPHANAQVFDKLVEEAGKREPQGGSQPLSDAYGGALRSFRGVLEHLGTAIRTTPLRPKLLFDVLVEWPNLVDVEPEYLGPTERSELSHIFDWSDDTASAGLKR